MTIVVVALLIVFGPGILLALVLVLLAVRDLRRPEPELDEAEVEDHARPRGNVYVLDEHRKAG